MYRYILAHKTSLFQLWFDVSDHQGNADTPQVTKVRWAKPAKHTTQWVNCKQCHRCVISCRFYLYVSIRRGFPSDQPTILMVCFRPCLLIRMLSYFSLASLEFLYRPLCATRCFVKPRRPYCWLERHSSCGSVCVKNLFTHVFKLDNDDINRCQKWTPLLSNIFELRLIEIFQVLFDSGTSGWSWAISELDQLENVHIYLDLRRTCAHYYLLFPICDSFSDHQVTGWWRLVLLWSCVSWAQEIRNHYYYYCNI